MTAAALPIPSSVRVSQWAALAALFGLTLRQHTHGRRLIVLGCLYLVPCVLAVVLRNLSKPAPPQALEFFLVFGLLPHALAPLTALLYASGVVSDEVEEQTLTYILMRSMPRWAIFVTKLAATYCVTAFLAAAAVLALYAAIYAGTPDFAAVLPRAAKAAATTVLAQFGYCALFALVGLFFRWSLVAGIAYIVVIEGGLASVNFVGRSLTIVYYVRTLTLRWLDLPTPLMHQSQDAWGMDDLETLPSAAGCVLIVTGVGALIAAVSALWFARHEYHVKTPGSD